MKGIFKKLTTLLIAAVLILSFVTATGAGSMTAEAAQAIGSITVDGKKTEYESLDSLVKDAEKKKGKTFTIDMYTDWGNNLLVIPERSDVTLNMNGHMYNRGLREYKRNGSVITINNKAILTVNGGSKDTSHSVDVYQGSHPYSDSIERYPQTFNGGLIAGGFSSNGGGGIDMYGAGVTLNLNDVTIAGCRAAQTWGTDGYGGGIWVHGGIKKGGTVNLNNTTITGCYATNDGGGIYQNNHNNFTLTLKNSHIINNRCGRNGGGIHVRGSYVNISGQGGSSVVQNHSGKNGGGIYAYNSHTSISGLTVNENISAEYGGGIYPMDTDVSLSNLTVKENIARFGGGMYILKGKKNIANIEVTGNKAIVSGGGIYVSKDIIDLSVSGKCVVKDNTNDNNKNENFTVYDGASYVNFDLSKGSEVHMGYRYLPDNWNLVTQGTGADGRGKDTDFVKSPNCIRYLYPDNEGWQFTYNSEENYRKIFYVRKGGVNLDNTGKPFTLVPTTAVDVVPEGKAETGKTVKGLSGKDYPLEYSYVRNSEGDLKIYYSDGFFDSDPFKYDEHLATLTMSMAMAGCYLNEGGTGPKGDYTNKHAAGREFMAAIGCNDQSIYVNDFNVMRPGTDTIGVTMASKEIETADDSFVLIPIVVRSAGYEREWASNVTIGTGMNDNGEAEGFADAANIVMDTIDTYIKKYDLEEKIKSGKAAFWVTGFSRGGATANLTSRRIRETYQNAKLFAYTFATPRGGSNNATKLPDEEYFCIHNIINSADLVPYVAMEYMGFVHYGVDHFMPGSPAGEVKKNITPLKSSASGSVNFLSQIVSYTDNEPYETKTEDYYNLRNQKMIDQLGAIDPDYVWDDYFHTARISMNLLKYIFGGKVIYEIGPRSNTAEGFLKNVFDILESDIIANRDIYSAVEYTYGTVELNTYQKALRDAMIILEGDSRSSSMDKLKGIKDAFKSSVGLKDFDIDYIRLLGNWKGLSWEKKGTLFNIGWKIIQKTGVLDTLGDDDKNNLRYNLPALLDIAFKLVDADIDMNKFLSDDNLQISGTFAYNIGRIFQNHLLQVYLAWLRTQDSYYDGENTAYAINRPAQIPMPQAKGKYNTEVPIEQFNTDAPAEFKMSETVILDVPELLGEAIYYDIENLTTGAIYRDKIYRGGIAIEEPSKYYPYLDYRITAYAKYLNTASDKVTFDVRVIGDTHQVTIDYSDYVSTYPDMENVTNFFKEGEAAVVLTRLPDGLNFMEWKAYDDQGRDVTNILGISKNKPVGKFTMPMPGEDGFSRLYSLTFVPVFDALVDSAELVVKAPAYGEELQKTGTVILRSGSNEKKRIENVPITWTFEQKKGRETIDVLTTHAPYNNTVYKAHVRIDQEDDFKFGKHVSASSPEANNVKSSKNNTAGYIYIDATFPATEMGYDYEREAVSLFIETWDKNLEESVKHSSTGADITKAMFIDPDSSGLTIPAPDAPDMAFNNWNALNSGLEISEDAAGKPTLVIDKMPEGIGEGDVLIIRAEYVPVIKKVYVQAIAPQASYTPSDEPARVKVTVSNEYTVDSSNIECKWSPDPDYGYEGKDFNYVTSYSLGIKIVPDEQGRVLLKKGSDNVYVNGQFVFSDELELLVEPVNSNMTILKDMAVDSVLDEENNELHISFPPTGEKKTDLKYITWPEDINGVPFEEYEAGLENVLPAELEIGVRDESVDHLPVKWTITHTGGPTDGSGVSEWLAEGKIELPERIRNKYNLSETGSLKITVEGADHAEAPTATVDSGRYLEDLKVGFAPLNMEGEIRYTLDGSDPVNGDVYNGEDFKFGPDAAAEDGTVLLRAVTVSPGRQNSAEAAYLYDFSAQVPAPETKRRDTFIDDEDAPGDGANTDTAPEEEDIYMGVEPELTYNTMPQIIAHASDQYTITGGEGVTIDEEGNALATNAGVYILTAKINDGYVWLIRDPETLEEKTTTEDQVFQVAIAKASIKLADISINRERKEYTFGEDTFTPFLVAKIEDYVLNPSVDYDIEYDKDGEGTITVTGIGNFKDTAIIEYSESDFDGWPSGGDAEQPTTTPPGRDEPESGEAEPEVTDEAGDDSEPASTAQQESSESASNEGEGQNNDKDTKGAEGDNSENTGAPGNNNGRKGAPASGGKVSKVSDTGDKNLMIIWIAVGLSAAVAATAAIAVLVRRRRKEH